MTAMRGESWASVKIDMPPSLVDRIEEAARKRGVRRAPLIREMLEKALDSVEAPPIATEAIGETERA
ncbi:MAG: ribbon-helix-helix protein, CopG family [Rhizobiales bacterium]|nr:ribbon-helix-helix protein, CopG family [Hyphomicrobiales bacterium]